MYDISRPSRDKLGGSHSLEVVVVGRGQLLTGAEQSLESLVLILNAADRQRDNGHV